MKATLVSPLRWQCPEAVCGNGRKMSVVLMVVQLGHQQEEKSFIQNKVNPLILDKVKAARRSAG